MKIFFLTFISLPFINGKLSNIEKIEFCGNLDCDVNDDKKVCGIKYGDDEVTFRLFDNECKLLKYGCQVEDRETYGIIDMKHCSSKLTTESDSIEHDKFIHECPDCKEEKSDPVCGIRPEGEGFRIRTFENICQLKRHNCDNDLEFTVTDYFICANDPSLEDVENEISEEEDTPDIVATEASVPNIVMKPKNLVIVDGSMLDMQNINESIKNFFATTHVQDLPIKNLQPVFNDTTRKMMLNIFGPITVFKPWNKVPKNKSEDYYHIPTLSSCYHKCPTKCPNTYAPVCGMPGITVREPSLMFKNHCLMDVAQCKMFWEGKSFTASGAVYIESSFLFCLGFELDGLYRFLPFIRTLQHMGRLKNKGHFRYKLKNMKFFNNLLSVAEPKLMG